MFVGHYSVSFALKAQNPKIPLWQLFLAVQFVDILFFGFTFLGIERFNIVPDFTASTHFELVFMPYTHSLLATFGWGALAYGAFRLPSLGGSRAAAAVIALAVVSHWLLDFVVHTPDLPLLGDDSLKVGLGLWRYDVTAFLLEAILLCGGAWLMLRNHPSAMVRRRTIGFLAVLLTMNAAIIFGPAEYFTTTALAVAGLASYFGFAGVAYWVEE